MDFDLSEEQELLQATLRGFVEKECPPATVRAAFDAAAPAPGVPAAPGGAASSASEGAWKGLVELGIAGLVIPEAQGGAGLDVLDLALVAEELGHGAVPSPFLGHSLASLAVVHGGSAAQRERWLPALASGEALGSIALAEPDGEATGAGWSPEGWGTALSAGKLSGIKQHVPHADRADLLVVGTAGGGLALVEAGAFAVTPMASVDRSHPLSRVAFGRNAAEAIGTGRNAAEAIETGRNAAEAIGTGRDAAEAIGTDAAAAEALEAGGPGLGARVRDAACVLLAADAFGAAYRLVRMASAYAGQRRQFGRPIAGFQAVKHQLADMALAVDPTRSLWWYAAHAWDQLPEEAPRAAALAKAHVTDRAHAAARDAVKIHGGLGFTWESDVQIWFKRTLFDRTWGGTPEHHRERIAALGGWLDQ